MLTFSLLSKLNILEKCTNIDQGFPTSKTVKIVNVFELNKLKNVFRRCRSVVRSSQLPNDVFVEYGLLRLCKGQMHLSTFVSLKSWYQEEEQHSTYFIQLKWVRIDRGSVHPACCVSPRPEKE